MVIHIEEMDIADPELNLFSDTVYAIIQEKDKSKKAIAYYRYDNKLYDGARIYAGKGNILASKSKRYTKEYPMLKDLPKKYKNVIDKLKILHKKHFGD